MEKGFGPQKCPVCGAQRHFSSWKILSRIVEYFLQINDLKEKYILVACWVGGCCNAVAFSTLLYKTQDIAH
ncbi:protein of unknown function [Cupriavidus taiwanensis]|nr:protein of unknown function [Cupriavidus taiwanensis]